MSEETPEVIDAPVVEEQPEVQAEVEKPATGDEAQAQEPSDSSPEKKEPKGVQKRIDELTRNWRETERDRDYWRELAVREKLQAPEQPKAPPQPTKTLEDFEYDEGKYQEYLLERASELAREEASKLYQEHYIRETQQRRQASFQVREADFAKGHDDYHDVTRNPSLSLTQAMYEIAADSEKGPEVLYYLGKNPDIADRLARMAPTQVAMELGRIEARLAAASKGSSVSNAPPPTPKIEAVEPSVAVKASSPDGDSLTTNEWLAKRMKEVENR